MTLDNDEDDETDLSEFCQSKGRKYVAGVFAKHLHEKDSTLGQFAIDLTNDDEFVRSEWIEKIKGGGLKFPRESLVEDIKMFENEFEKFHKPSTDGLLRSKGVTKNLIEILSNAYPKYSTQLIKKFVFAKTMHRLRWIQHKDKKAHQVARESLRSKTKRLAHQY